MLVSNYNAMNEKYANCSECHYLLVDLVSLLSVYLSGYFFVRLSVSFYYDEQHPKVTVSGGPFVPVYCISIDFTLPLLQHTTATCPYRHTYTARARASALAR